MAIAGRHIRHDWQTFVDWEQKSVRTVCGRTTKQNLAGVPGVTEQPLVVKASENRNLSGWCALCADSVERAAVEILASVELTPEIRERYIKVVAATNRAAETYRARQQPARRV